MLSHRDPPLIRERERGERGTMVRATSYRNFDLRNHNFRAMTKVLDERGMEEKVNLIALACILIGAKYNEAD